jgi:subtilisin-like proprotein convertase family protein
MTASMCQPATIMNARTLALAASALALAPAASHAAVYSHQWNSGFASTLIPDGNPTGWSDTRGVSIPADEIITDVNVSLQLRGGWNGDLYVILTHTGSPNAAVLLNRPGRTASAPFGYDDSVLTITMDDAASRGDIHFYRSQPDYPAAISGNQAWQPDGRAVSPLLVDGTEARTALLSIFNGTPPADGQWTLFTADLSAGSQTEVVAWGLTITTIPEPTTASLSVAACAMLARRRRSAQGTSHR